MNTFDELLRLIEKPGEAGEIRLNAVELLMNNARTAGRHRGGYRQPRCLKPFFLP